MWVCVCAGVRIQGRGVYNFKNKTLNVWNLKKNKLRGLLFIIDSNSIKSSLKHQHIELILDQSLKGPGMPVTGRQGQKTMPYVHFLAAVRGKQLCHVKDFL